MRCWSLNKPIVLVYIIGVQLFGILDQLPEFVPRSCELCLVVRWLHLLRWNSLNYLVLIPYGVFGVVV